MKRAIAALAAAAVVTAAVWLIISGVFRGSKTDGETDPGIVPDSVPEESPDVPRLPDTYAIKKNVEKIVSEYPERVSVAYCNLATNETFFIGGETVYFYQSTVKPIYAQFCLESGLDPEEKAVMEKSPWGNGTEIDTVLPEYEHDFVNGQSYTWKQYIESSVVYSNNKAYYMLFSRYGADDFNAFLRDKVGTVMSTTQMYECCTVMNMMDCLKYIYEKNGEIYSLMKKSVYRVTGFTTPLGYEIAAKEGFGGDSGEIYDVGRHAAMIIEAPEPYILVIFTEIRSFGTDIFDRVIAGIEQAYVDAAGEKR